MKTPQMPSPEHGHFDAICEPVDDFETLPTITVDPGPEYELEEEKLDDLILAGLVAPY
jgi:hypothetical protein